MNAPHMPTGPAGHMVEREIEWLPVGAIEPNQSAMQQLRRARIITDEGVAQLAASVKVDGVLQPLLVRPLAMSGAVGSSSAFATHELIFGERRWRAAQLAGLEHVPCIVRDLSDAEVLRAQLAENIQRESITPLEEAEGYRALLAIPLANGEKLDAETLGAQVGRSRAGIYDHLRLLDLPPEGRQALIDGRIDMYMGLVVARVRSEKLQAKALAWALRPGMTVRNLKSHISGGEFTQNLITAHFALDDATLHPAAGPCTTCPNRSANCGEFDESEDDPNVCTDVPCFKVKVELFNDRALQRARESGRAVITGAAARKIIPRRGVLVDYIDLDMVCDEDEFTEVEPKDDESPEWANWSERQAAWQPRTYRALMEPLLKGSEKLEAEHVEDPHTGRLRELVPVERARRLLKRASIALPLHAGAGDQDDERQPASQQASMSNPARQQSPEEFERANAERERQLQAQQERTEAEIAFRNALLKAIWKKATGPLKADELHAILDLLDGPPTYAVGHACLGVDSFDERKRLLERMKEGELARVIRVALVAGCVNFPDQHPGALLELARLHRIDPAQVRKDLKGGAKVKAVQKARKPAAKPTTKPAARKAATKKPKRK